jgi:hypothetical protein
MPNFSTKAPRPSVLSPRHTRAHIFQARPSPSSQVYSENAEIARTASQQKGKCETDK